MPMNILTESSLSIDGFANIKERRYIMDEKSFGDHRDENAFSRFASVIYLADAFIRPQGHTGRHSHKNVDIITVLIRGQLSHQGSLGDGITLHGGDIQVQYAGSVGFEHNEINPASDFNRLIQIWAQPPADARKMGATYESFHCAPGERQRPYLSTSTDEGGNTITTVIDVIRTKAGDAINLRKNVMLFLVSGTIRFAERNQEYKTANEPTLICASNLQISAESEAWLIAIHHSPELFRGNPVCQPE